MWEMDHRNAESWSIDAFEPWCCRRLLRVPQTARRSNQSVLKVISPEYSLEGLMLKLKLQYFGHLMQRTDSLEMTLMLRKGWRQKKGKTEDEMVERHHQLDGHEFEQPLGVGDGQGRLAYCSPVQFSCSVVSDSVTPWIVACQASLSITNCWSLPKPMSIESVMPSNHLILCCPLLLLPAFFPNIRVFSNESALHIRWPKYWSFSFNVSSSNEHSGLISLGWTGWIS